MLISIDPGHIRDTLLGESNMKRILIAGILGAIVYFIWGMAAWMMLPIHEGTLHGMLDEDRVTLALSEQNLASGVYVVPWTKKQEDWSNPESDWWKKHESGPLYSIYYHTEGGTPMGKDVMLGGFIIDLLAATLAACLLSSAVSGCCNTYARRVGFVLGLGLFVALIGHANYWNWMHFPADYTVAFIVDVVVGWTLAGLVLAAIVRPSPARGSDQSQET